MVQVVNVLQQKKGKKVKPEGYDTSFQLLTSQLRVRQLESSLCMRQLESNCQPGTRV